ncbi:hypothetical protein ABZR86_02540 [Dyella marensis]|uniref:Uncharacterized protein n=1 Tax=Dyella marensis TaxID=500610 RepID=A0A1I1ZZS6_9GAMM|nr:MULTISPECIES: hypothetical protein [Dyella]SFE37007.1 hypothetical protein SAMN02799615_00866 [Dyella marensis]
MTADGEAGKAMEFIPLPLEDEVMAAVKRYPGRVTYFIRNSVLFVYPGITTAKVRRVLMRLEKVGSVKRVPSVYARDIAWAVTEAGQA